MPRADIEFSVEEALRGVVVRVHDDGGEMQLPGAGRNIIGAHNRHH